MSEPRQLRDTAGQVVPVRGQKVFGEPYETPDGTTIITVSRLSWNGTSTVPLGVFAIREGEASWQPAVDATRIALMGETIGLAAAVIATLAVLRRPPWPDLSGRRHPRRPA